MDVDEPREGTRHPTAKEKQSLVWRDVVIPGLVDVYMDLLASTNNLANLNDVKNNGVQFSGCVNGIGAPMHVICLYFDKGLGKLLIDCFVRLSLTV